MKTSQTRLPAAVEADARAGLGSGVRGRNPIGEAEGVLGGNDPVVFKPVGAYGMSNKLTRLFAVGIHLRDRVPIT